MNRFWPTIKNENSCAKKFTKIIINLCRLTTFFDSKMERRTNYRLKLFKGKRRYIILRFILKDNLYFSCTGCFVSEKCCCIITVIIFVIGARPCASCSKRVSFIIWLQFNFFYGSYCLIILLEVLWWHLVCRGLAEDFLLFLLFTVKSSKFDQVTSKEEANDNS